LAGKSAANNINSSDKFFAVEGSDVAVDRNVRPMLTQDGLAEGVNFAEGDGPEAASCFKSEGETSNAAK
jgi:hypothetical protein